MQNFAKCALPILPRIPRDKKVLWEEEWNYSLHKATAQNGIPMLNFPTNRIMFPWPLMLSVFAFPSSCQQQPKIWSRNRTELESLQDPGESWLPGRDEGSSLIGCSHLQQQQQLPVEHDGWVDLPAAWREEWVDGRLFTSLQWKQATLLLKTQDTPLQACWKSYWLFHPRQLHQFVALLFSSLLLLQGLSPSFLVVVPCLSPFWYCEGDSWDRALLMKVYD